MRPADAPPAPPLAPGQVPVTPVHAGGAVPASQGAAVEQRVVGTELHTRRHDRPGEGPPDLTFLEALPAEIGSSVAFPLPYRLARPTGYGGVSVRLAESDPARTRAYPCQPFYKPISRCVGGGG